MKSNAVCHVNTINIHYLEVINFFHLVPLAHKCTVLKLQNT